MSTLHIILSNRLELLNNQNLTNSGYHFDFYNENYCLMRSKLDEVISSFNTQFSLVVTFEMQDMLSYSLLCELLTYVHIENSTHRKIMTINAVISENWPLNKACKQSANLLSEALAEILLDVKLFSYDEVNYTLKSAQLNGSELFNKLVYISIECDRKLLGYRNDPILEELKKRHLCDFDEIDDYRKRLSIILANEREFKTFMKIELQLFENEQSTSGKFTNSNNEIELHNRYEEANRFMKAEIDQMLFSYRMQS